MRKYLLALAASLAATLAFALPFAPIAAGSNTITCTSSSAATALGVAVPANQSQLELQNAGTVDIYVEVGTSGAVAAVATGYPVRPGHTKLISVNSTVTHVACIVTSGTATLYVSVGNGDS